MIEELLAVYLVHLSYFALVFIPVISSLGFPFSEELVLLGAGYLAATGFIRWDIGIILVFIGVLAGDNSAYFLGRQGGKLFNWVVPERKLKKASRFANKHGPKAVFIARFIPGLRWLVPIIVGASRMKYRKFFFKIGYYSFPGFPGIHCSRYKNNRVPFTSCHIMDIILTNVNESAFHICILCIPANYSI